MEVRKKISVQILILAIVFLLSCLDDEGKSYNSMSLSSTPQKKKFNLVVHDLSICESFPQSPPALNNKNYRQAVCSSLGGFYDDYDAKKTSGARRNNPLSNTRDFVTAISYDQSCWSSASYLVSNRIMFMNIHGIVCSPIDKAIFPFSDPWEDCGLLDPVDPTILYKDFSGVAASHNSNDIYFVEKGVLAIGQGYLISNNFQWHQYFNGKQVKKHNLLLLQVCNALPRPHIMWGNEYKIHISKIDKSAVVPLNKYVEFNTGNANGYGVPERISKRCAIMYSCILKDDGFVIGSWLPFSDTQHDKYIQVLGSIISHLKKVGDFDKAPVQGFLDKINENDDFLPNSHQLQIMQLKNVGGVYKLIAAPNATFETVFGE